EGFSRAVTHVFVELYKRDLLYRDKRLVNWDPKFQTAISDLEVETRDVQGKFWTLSYPLADGSGAIQVATTRPETMLADMAVAVHPDDERYRGIVGKQIRQPITGRLIPVITDEHADPDLGSGAVKFALPALQAVKKGDIKIVPETWAKTWFNWLENIQPWCVSRQLWWGHRIPAWYAEDGHVFVAESEEEATAQAGGKPLRQDEDVLDTWFSSALWPFATLGWPDETDDLKRHYPNDVLISGFDILFFWDA